MTASTKFIPETGIHQIVRYRGRELYRCYLHFMFAHFFATFLVWTPAVPNPNQKKIKWTDCQSECQIESRPKGYTHNITKPNSTCQTGRNNIIAVSRTQSARNRVFLFLTVWFVFRYVHPCFYRLGGCRVKWYTGLLRCAQVFARTILTVEQTEIYEGACTSLC